MKKIIIISAGLFIMQRSSAQVSLAPEAGLQMVSMNLKNNAVIGIFPRPEYKASFRAGLNFAADINNVSIHAGVFYAAKGYKMTYGGTTFSKANLNYIDLPVYINYNIINKNGNKFFAGIGPYVSYCISGKSKIDLAFIDPSLTGTEEYELSVGTSVIDDDIKPIDLGINANIGYISPIGIYVRAQYSLGLTNTLPGDDSDNSLKNRAYGISVGYQIGLNKKTKLATAQ